MSGVFGLDPQFSRTCLVLAQRSGASVPAAVHAIGDGRRKLIPNAVVPRASDSLWASAAAEWRLGSIAVAEPAALGEQLHEWICTPADAEFGSGVRQRIFEYLGRTRPTPANGYRMRVAVGAGGTPNLSGLDELGDIELIASPIALLHRWFADADAPADIDTEVIALACGESETAAMRCRVTRSAGTSRIDVLDHRTCAVGSWEISAALGRRVLERCKPGILGRDLLPMLDGCLEFASALHRRPAHAPQVWAGPFAHRMFSPLSLTRTEMESWPQVAAVREAVHTVIGSLGPSGEKVVVGGLGAVWPFPRMVAGEFGTVWAGANPALDLAAGAALSDQASVIGSTLAPFADREPLELLSAAEPTGYADSDAPPPWLR